MCQRAWSGIFQSSVVESSFCLQDPNDNEPADPRAEYPGAALTRRPLSPASLLSAPLPMSPPSLVATPGRLGGLASLGGYGGAAGERAGSASPPPREAPSPPASSAGHSPGHATPGQATWNYEEQFKQVSTINSLSH